MLRRLQAAGQWLFLHAERVLNRAFGERCNPLYYLGAISYGMFWVVVASGFYIYVFYETGVDTTYASVERITHGQWYLGGVLRSVHRYASDAMVLSMLLHMTRHFVFDRYRSFRAFSWITGVVVMWLVYVSGVNGYMLPWDRMGQYVAIASAEWLDALPVFRGTLVRNFIFPEAITDRFFSLLQFLHIGIPLAVLVALWIHTQRVPKARTLPPRPLALGLGVMLLVLALVKPAVSQGAADMGRAPIALAYDWFYLTVFPLIDRWDPLKLWWLVGGATVLAFFLPWLPPRRRRAGTLTMTTHPGPHAVPVREGETLLDAGLRAGLALPYECRAGGCGVCKATLLNGEIDWGVYQPSALSAEERARGRFLLCCACAKSEVEIEIEPGAALADAALTEVEATVADIAPLAPDVMGLTLALPAGQSMRFTPGQYLNVVLEDGARRSYSFTDASGCAERIELHIRRIPGGRFTARVFGGLKVGDTLRIEGPLGRFQWQEIGERPVLFVAGATGFAPVKSLLEAAFARGLSQPLELYWGVRKPSDLYMAALCERWTREHPNFRFVPVVSEPSEAEPWTGRTGLVHEAILADHPDLSGMAVYACGSLAMVQTAQTAFLARGLPQDACYSDAFVPAARPA